MTNSPALTSVPTLHSVSDNRSHLFEQLAGSSLLADGLVNLIVLESIADRFGVRWNAKREAVFEHVERVLARITGETGYFARVSETDFLVAHPDLGPFSAQALCLRAFREIWTHFLGEVPHPEFTVHKVTEISKQQITAVPVDPTEALAGEVSEQAAAAAGRSGEAQSILVPSRWTPFVATDGRKIRVSCSLEPVYSLKSRSRIGFRLCRQIIDMGSETRLTAGHVASLSRADLLRIDMATMSYGTALLKSETSEKPELSLIVPLSYVSLSHHPSRQTIAAALAEARRSVLVGYICEIYDAEDVPHASFLEVVSIVRKWSLIVVARLRGMPSASMKNAGLQALSVSCPANVVTDAEFVHWLTPWLRAGKRLASPVMVYRCASVQRMEIAGSLGASHGGFRSNPDESIGSFPERI